MNSCDQQNFLNFFKNEIGLTLKDVDNHKKLRRASVLVPLFFLDNCTNNKNNDDDNGESSPAETAVPYLLLTQRTLALKSHPGQVCFPGGKQDAEDALDDVKTALRETQEEVGLDPGHVEILGRLRTLESVNHLCVTPIIGFISRSSLIVQKSNPTMEEEEEESSPSGLNINRHEVEAVFWCPLHIFLEHDRLKERYEVEWSGETFVYRSYEYNFTDPNSGKATTFDITGLTAHIAHHVADLVSHMLIQHRLVPSEQLLLSSASGAPNSGESGPLAAEEKSNTAAVVNNAGDLEGFLWKREDSRSGRFYWSRRFFVLASNDSIGNASDKELRNGDKQLEKQQKSSQIMMVLHQYDNLLQAKAKSASANKKNRLHLSSMDSSVRITNVDHAQAAVTKTEKWEFVVGVLDGRIEWHLAAETSEERAMWKNAIMNQINGDKIQC